MSIVASARVIKAAFASYRRAMEIARDPDEAARARDAAWARAANARARIDRHVAIIEGARPA